jgi:hypothetical protein
MTGEVTEERESEDAAVVTEEEEGDESDSHPTRDALRADLATLA